MKKTDWFWLKSKYWLIGAGCSVLIGMGNLQLAKAADRLTTDIGPIQISMQLDDLERFAQDGTEQGNVKLLARRLDAEQLGQFRQLLQRKFQLNPTTISRLLNTPMADDLLQRIGSVIEISSGQNGADAIHSAVLQSAEQPDGFTPLDVLRLYPSANLRINLSSVLRLKSEFETLLTYSRASVQAIEQEATREATSEIAAANLPDLRLPGVSVTKYQKTFSIEAIRPTALGLASRYDLNVDIYVPANLTSPAPVIVQTHGFGASRDNYEYISEHLASHGFVVVAPEHLGSNLEYRQSLLEGHLSELLNPMEYISRPLDITYMLDQLEQLAATDPDWKQRLNLQQVGIFGYSFGGTTALSSAGATIDVARLRASCADSRLTPSPSVLIMCRAQHLPVEAYDLVDPRIKAVMAAYPLTSLIFGPVGMSNISVPTLILSGSRDIVAPSVPEQVEPFLWLTTPHKYLALMVTGTHFSTSDIRYSGQYPEAIRGPNTAIGQDYLRALSVAFFLVW